MRFDFFISTLSCLSSFSMKDTEDFNFVTRKWIFFSLRGRHEDLVTGVMISNFGVLLYF
jgi:hypothetical protein